MMTVCVAQQKDRAVQIPTGVTNLSSFRRWAKSDGFPEQGQYWLVDPRGNELSFEILRHGPKRYASAKKAAGWVRSAVFGKSFRLERGTDPLGLTSYALHFR